MTGYSTKQAAQKLDVSFPTLNRYIGDKKIPVPPVQDIGGGKFRVWTKEDIERVRKILPKIKNGRKTRYQKKHPGISIQQSAKPKSKAKRNTKQKSSQPRAAVPHISSRKKKSKP